ncbi:uncharacterized protein LOC113593790 isoform X5 [Acinonyx jubatus]|uniref:Uncharacterized protein LOC113593790 isoform X5 n=1 Tax=Acinonyx jubatus TaxID=32536 RepID=A0A6J1XT98_ACIJB|nr:uncharacterized protein LOC113593790 isoform X5 [Acinonyx jubatus]
MAAGCEPPTPRRRRPLCVSTNPASTQRRAALHRPSPPRRWRFAGRWRGGTDSAPLQWAGAGGSEGRGRSAAGRVRPPPAALPLPPPPPFPPSRSAPPGFPALTFPPTRVAALGGQAGMEPSCSRRASQPPPLPGNSQEQTENEQTDVPHCDEETESREG